MCYLCLCRKFVEKEYHTVPGPVEVEAQVGDQGASSLEVNVGQRALMPTLVQRMMTEVLYCEIHKRITAVVSKTIY